MNTFRRAFGNALEEMAGQLMPSLEAELHRQFELSCIPLPPVNGKPNPELVRGCWQRRMLRRQQRKMREQGFARIFSKALLTGAAVQALHSLERISVFEDGNLIGWVACESGKWRAWNNPRAQGLSRDIGSFESQREAEQALVLIWRGYTIKGVQHLAQQGLLIEKDNQR
jgi:hypothetical protein